MSSIKDPIKVTGAVSITLCDQSGEIKEQYKFKNLVVSSGKEYIASRMLGATMPVISHMAVGGGTSAPTTADIALGAELGRSALTSSTQNTNVVTCAAFFGSGVATGNITEAGLFNNPSTGAMISRVSFAPIGKSAGDTLDVSWTLTVN